MARSPRDQNEPVCEPVPQDGPGLECLRLGRNRDTLGSGTVEAGPGEVHVRVRNRAGWAGTGTR